MVFAGSSGIVLAHEIRGEAGRKVFHRVLASVIPREAHVCPNVIDPLPLSLPPSFQAPMGSPAFARFGVNYFFATLAANCRAVLDGRNPLMR